MAKKKITEEAKETIADAVVEAINEAIGFEEVEQPAQESKPEIKKEEIKKQVSTTPGHHSRDFRS
jgi:hypothetical protein